MALGKNYSSRVKRSEFNASNVEAIDEGLGFVHCTRALGRKRVVVSDHMEECPLSSPFRTPLKRRHGPRTNTRKSLLEALPQDLLVRILCGVDHDDLKQLFHVSKLIRDATLVAKQLHFAYSTPSSKTAGLRVFSDLEDDSHDAPNAPKHRRAFRSRIGEKKLSGISVALFHSPEGERWPRNTLLMETDI